MNKFPFKYEVTEYNNDYIKVVYTPQDKSLSVVVTKMAFEPSLFTQDDLEVAVKSHIIRGAPHIHWQSQKIKADKTKLDSLKAALASQAVGELSEQDLIEEEALIKSKDIELVAKGSPVDEPMELVEL